MTDKSPKTRKKSLIAKIRNYFLAGVVVMIPIAATVYLTIFIINVSKNSSKIHKSKSIFTFRYTGA